MSFMFSQSDSSDPTKFWGNFYIHKTQQISARFFQQVGQAFQRDAGLSLVYINRLILYFPEILFY